MDTEYIKLIRARTVNIADANTASVSCQVDLAMPGDGGSGIAAQEFVAAQLVVAKKVPLCGVAVDVIWFLCMHGRAWPSFYKEIDDNDENGSTFYNGTIDVPDSVCAAMCVNYLCQVHALLIRVHIDVIAKCCALSNPVSFHCVVSLNPHKPQVHPICRF